MIAGVAAESTSSESASSYLSGKECRSLTGSAVKFRQELLGLVSNSLYRIVAYELPEPSSGS